jgi:Ca2+-binding EF-hand superfamily protein
MPAEFIRHAWTGDSSAQATSLKKLRSEFAKLDLDGDGRISRDEFRAMAERALRNGD